MMPWPTRAEVAAAKARPGASTPLRRTLVAAAGIAAVALAAATRALIIRLYVTLVAFSADLWH